MTEDRVLRLGHLYPRQMNVYGDRGNIITLAQRCRRRVERPLLCSRRGSRMPASMLGRSASARAPAMLTPLRGEARTKLIESSSLDRS